MYSAKGWVLILGLCSSYVFPAEATATASSSESPSITKQQADLVYEGCNRGDGEACYIYSLYASELKDFAESRFHYKRACELGHDQGCQQMKIDDSEGEAIRKQCDAGEVSACRRYSIGRARIYSDFLGSIQYAKKACKLGDQSSCDLVKSAAERRNDGVGAKRD
jgi:hypothetical protein